MGRIGLIAREYHCHAAGSRQDEEDQMALSRRSFVRTVGLGGVSSAFIAARGQDKPLAAGRRDALRHLPARPEEARREADEDRLPGDGAAGHVDDADDHDHHPDLDHSQPLSLTRPA